MRETVGKKHLVMTKFIGWLACLAVLGYLIWQTAAAEPVLPRAVSGSLLVLISVLAGLRLGADSAAAYTEDLQRLNKVLADQNEQLQDANALLLRQVSAKSKGTSKSA
jgi:hypothetical protein